ncbi:MAG: hypothetical protein JKY53_10770 [Flavobacteriales bacterium]|nr:hypothetical protein [Flavobacteriales bacterium]
MALIDKSEIREVTGISQVERKSIMNFLQGAVYCWCKNRKNEWFSMWDLMGGDNYYWDGTPLLVLYTKHENKGKDSEQAVKDAGKDSGWLLKKTVHEDIRYFESKKEELTRKYRWVDRK